MRRSTKIFSSFTKWFLRQPWNIGIVLRVHPGTTTEQKGTIFTNWISEIERTDGSLEFSYVHFVPKTVQAILSESYVFVGGINLGDWWHWARRWAAMNGGPRDGDVVLAGFAYSRRGQSPKLRAVMAELIEDSQFIVQMRLGPKFIRRSRTMRVDPDGPCVHNSD